MRIPGVILFVFLFIFPFCIHAQRNAPVAGDAAHLIDLLKKDYSQIESSLQLEQISKDRRIVISILQSYMTEDQVAAMSKKTYDATDSLNFLKNELQIAKTDLKSHELSGVNLKLPSAEEAKAYGDTHKVKRDAVYNRRNRYHAKLFQLDSQIFGRIDTVYMGANNLYLSQITRNFISKYDLLRNSTNDAFAQLNYQSSIEKSIPIIGGDFDIAMVMEELSRFLVDRIKAELTNNVIGKVQEWLNHGGETDPLAEFKVLLPRTTDYLKSFNANQIPNFTHEIKQYIEDDLSSMLENAVELQSTPRVRNLINSNPDLAFAFEALELIPQLSSLKHPLDYFKILESSPNLLRWKKDDNYVKHNLANAIHLASMIAHSLSIIENGQTKFAGQEFLSNYSSEVNFYLCYIGMLHQQNIKYYDIDFKIKRTATGLTSMNLENVLQSFMRSIPPTKADKLTEEILEEAKFICSLLQQLGGAMEGISSKAESIRKANRLNKQVSLDTVHEFVEDIIDFTEQLVEVGDTLMDHLFLESTVINVPGGMSFKLRDSSRINLEERAKDYLTVARSGNDVVYDLGKKKYATAIIKALEIVTQITPEKVNLDRDLLAFLTKMSNDNFIRNADEWLDVLEYIEKTSVPAGAAVPVETAKEKTKEAATVVLKELNGIIGHYSKIADPANVAQANLLANLKLLRSSLSSLIMHPNLSWSTTLVDLGKIQSLKNDPLFQELLVDYYCGVSIATLTSGLETKLVSFQIDEINVFTASQAADVAMQVRDIAHKKVIALIYPKKKDRKKNAKEVEKLISSLQDVAIHYISTLSTRFDWKIDPNILKLIHFINDLAVAEDSEAVKSAIENIALPVGSYSIKRDAIFDISLNSYPGIVFGHEFTTPARKQVLNSAAFTAPVGLSFAWGSKKNGSSNGLFVPIIDLAAMTRFRFNNDTTLLNLQNFGFHSVFSPGLYYNHGFRKTPLSFQIGAQYGPMLKSFDANGEAKLSESIFVGAGVVLDIPILKLHNKPRMN